MFERNERNITRYTGTNKHKWLDAFGFKRSIDRDARKVDVITSTKLKARDHAIILPEAWELEAYRDNPVVLWEHDRWSPPIAKATDIRINSDGMIQTHVFDDDPASDMIFNKIVNGFINTTSVRWIGHSTKIEMINDVETLIFTRAELLEVSWVTVPADPKALVMRADGEPFNLDDYRVREVVEAIVQTDVGNRVITQDDIIAQLSVIDDTSLDQIEREITRLRESRLPAPNEPDQSSDQRILERLDTVIARYKRITEGENNG